MHALRRYINILKEAGVKQQTKIIVAYLPDLGADGVLQLRWMKDPKWVEIRGDNFWKGYDPEDALHKVLDNLIAPHVAWLMAGQEVPILPEHPDYEFAKALLTQE